MRLRLLGGLLAAGLSVLLSFCVYVPDEDFVKKIEDVDPESFTISLGKYDNLDTIYVEGPVTFFYNLGSGLGVVQEVRIYYNDHLSQTLTEPAGTFGIVPSTGIYRMRVEFVSTSGSGSLADQAGGELVQVWREYVIKAFVETLPDVPVITTSVVNGYSVISWPSYTRTKFKNYRIEVDNIPVKYITDPEITTWTDSTYTGINTRTYSVFVENEVGITYASVTRSGNPNLTIDASFNPADSMITVRFPKQTFYGVFASYDIKENGLNTGQVTDPNRTSYSFKSSNIGINFSSVIDVYYYPRGSIMPALGSKTINTSIGVTSRFPRPILKFGYNKDLNSIIGFWNSGTNNENGKLFRINPGTFTITDSVSIYNGPGYHIPYGGEFAYYSRPKQLVQVSLINKAEKAIDAITSTYGSGPSVIRGSENQLVSYTWFGPPPTGTGVRYYTRVYNFATGVELSLIALNPSLISYSVSDDGQFVMALEHEVYRVSTSTIIKKGNIGITGTTIGYRPDKSEELMTISGNTIYIFNLNTMNLNRSIAAPGGSTFVTYDVMTKYLVFNNVDAKKIYCIHIDTGERKEFNASLSGFSFINGTLILNSRNFIKLF